MDPTSVVQWGPGHPRPVGMSRIWGEDIVARDREHGRAGSGRFQKQIPNCSTSHTIRASRLIGPYHGYRGDIPASVGWMCRVVFELNTYNRTYALPPPPPFLLLLPPAHLHYVAYYRYAAASLQQFFLPPPLSPLPRFPCMSLLTSACVVLR